MVYEGAAGATAREMIDAFNFPKNSKILRLQLSNSRRSLEIGKGKNEFSVANSL
jgi:serine protease inhibitor